MMAIAFPYRFDAHGRTADTTGEQRIRELLEQILFTAPGERVHRADFGSGLLRILFAGNSPETAHATQAIVHGAVQQWLGDQILVEAIEVESVDNLMTVKLSYRVKKSGERRQMTLERGI